MTSCYATIAEYFRIGLEVGFVEPAVARVWADAVVEALAQPPAEIIEVAWSKGLPELLTNLRLVPGERDGTLAGKWMLGALRDCLPSDDEHLERSVRQALQICVAAGLDSESYCRFDLIDDQLSLARTGAYGSIAECRMELLVALAGYPAPPAELRASNVNR